MEGNGRSGGWLEMLPYLFGSLAVVWLARVLFRRTAPADAQAPPPSPAEAENDATLRLSSGAHELRGLRPTMEDTHVVFDELPEQPFEESPVAYYAVYDGHRGRRAAEYAAEHLHVQLREALDGARRAQEQHVTEAMRRAYQLTDERLLEEARQNSNWNDGSTAACALVVGRQLFVANCGDAEILLGRLSDNDDGVEAVELTHKHKPTDPEERQRIQQQGGLVLGGRVGGSLAVARALGDLDFKTPFDDGALHIGTLISAEPHISCTTLDPERDRFIIIGCDGVWERLSHRDTVNFCYKHLVLEHNNAESTAEALATFAFRSRSQDNISTIVVRLDWE